jgi:hypothetical protein
MKSSVAEIPTIIGTAFAGGFYAGRIRIGDEVRAIIVAPKAEGELQEIAWNDNYKSIDGAKSFNNGLANTLAMAGAGSVLGKWVRDLSIGGHDDWYIPSLDELEVIYRNLKPTTRENYGYMRSGINLNAVTPTEPYTPDIPLQTQAEMFQEGGAEAFEANWYWTSTQYATVSDYAWCQVFDDGYQYYDGKGDELRARAVRSLVI